MKALLLSLCFCLLLIPSLSSTTLEEACKKISKTQKEFDFCNSTLGAYPESPNANSTELAVLSVVAARDQYDIIDVKLLNLMRGKGSSPALKSAAEQCDEIYTDGDYSLFVSVDDIHAGKEYADSALLQIRSARGNYEDCQNVFKEEGLKPVLDEEGPKAVQLIDICIKFVELLK